jgi:hypothetical protein
MFEEVKAFIEANILHSQLWDVADESTQRKAVNNALMNLHTYYGESKEFTALPVALQVMWLLQIDDTIKRAGQGVTSISVGGMSISISQMDRTISPDVLRQLGRKIGRYDSRIEDTYRHRTNPNYAKRGY